MLYNPKWQRPSVMGFKTWVKAQPMEKTFQITSPLDCPLAKYLQSIGSGCVELMHRDYVMYNELLAFPMRVQQQPRTFGGLLAEILKEQT
jgi:hypothetical protein